MTMLETIKTGPFIRCGVCGAADTQNCKYKETQNVKCLRVKTENMLFTKRFVSHVNITAKTKMYNIEESFKNLPPTEPQHPLVQRIVHELLVKYRTQMAAAKASKCSSVLFHKFCRGITKNPSFSTLSRMCDALGYELTIVKKGIAPSE